MFQWYSYFLSLSFLTIGSNKIQQSNFRCESHIPVYDKYQQIVVLNRSITIVTYDYIGKNKINRVFSIVIIKIPFSIVR